MKNIKHINYQNDNGNSCLHYSIRMHSEIVAFLIEKGANVNVENASGATPLMWATTNGKLEAIKILVENGANINAKNEQDETALIIAKNKLENKNPHFSDIVEYLENTKLENSIAVEKTDYVFSI